METQTSQSQAMQPDTFRFRPAVDIFESGDDYLFIADVPGVAPDEVELTVEHGVLRISSHRSDGDWDYARSFELPDAADAEAIQAKLKDGVLSVTVAKRADKRPRKVVVELS